MGAVVSIYITILIICFIFCRTPGSPSDKTPPKLTCPANINKIADTGQLNAFVDWVQPLAIDNKDGEINPVRVSGQWSHTRFDEGTSTVKYRACDRSGNCAECTFTVTVFVIHCPKPANILNGSYIYSPGMDYRYGGATFYNCYRGYKLSDDKPRLDCLSTGQWSKTAPYCQKVQCPPPPDVNRAVRTCSDSWYFQSECIYTCATGYGVQPGQGTKLVCNYDGKWLGSPPTCIDIQAPTFSNCPINKLAYTAANQNFSNVTWSAPDVTDNSGETLKPVLVAGQPPESAFVEGSHLIQYTAKDSAGNVAQPCTFTIYVRKLICSTLYPKPNLIVSCPSGYGYGANCSFRCDNGFVLENNIQSGSCLVKGSPPRTFWSWAGGSDMPNCLGLSCAPLSPPSNGALACDNWLYGQFCKMFCKDGFSVSPLDIPLAQNLLVCSSDGRWNSPNSISILPHCIPALKILKYKMNVDVNYNNYFNGSCCDPAVQQQISALFVKIINASLFQSACTLHPECTVNNVIVTCSEACSVRKKRDTTSTGTLTATIFVTTSSPPSTANQMFKAIVTSTRDEMLSNESLSGLFYGLTASQMTLACDPGLFPNYVSQSCVGCGPGNQLNYSSNTCSPCPVNSYQDDPSGTCQPCPDYGKTLTGGATSEQCLDACVPGYFSTTGLAPCTPCPLGEYSVNYRATACTACVPGETTQLEASKLPTDCQAYELMFVPGVADKSFMMQTSIQSNSLKTISIIMKYFIPKDFSASSELLSVIDNDNQKSLMTISIDDSLNLHYEMAGCNFSAAKQLSAIADNWNTVSANFNISSMEVLFFQANGVNSKWHSLNCSIASPEYSNNFSISLGSGQFVGSFTDVNLWTVLLNETQFIQHGRMCGTGNTNATLLSWNFVPTLGQFSNTILSLPSTCDVVDDCLSAPCGGDNTCVDGLSSFHCLCKDGFTGVHCEVNIDDCLNNACADNSTCVDGNNTYKCACDEDSKGQFCEEQVVNGNFSDWGEWGSCTKSCAGGIQQRQRYCNQPSPDPVYGKPCEGESVQTKECNPGLCPVCQNITVPDHSHLICHEDDPDRKNCTLQCDDWFAFSQTPQDYYYCNRETNFTWSFESSVNPNGYLPGCSQMGKPNDMEVKQEIVYADQPCSAETKVATTNLVKRNLENITCYTKKNCSLKSLTFPGCDHGGSTKREAQVLSVLIILSSGNIKGSNNKTDSAIEVVNNLNNLEDAAQSLTSMINNGSFTVTDFASHYYVSGQSVEGVVSCPSGSIQVQFFCVPCDVGTYQSDTVCEFCDVGFYQQSQGQTSCVACPVGLSTAGRGSFYKSDCSVSKAVTSNSNQNVVIIILVCVLVPAVTILLIIIIYKKRCISKHVPEEMNHASNTYVTQSELPEDTDQSVTSRPGSSRPGSCRPGFSTPGNSRPKSSAGFNNMACSTATIANVEVKSATSTRPMTGNRFRRPESVGLCIGQYELDDYPEKSSLSSLSI